MQFSHHISSYLQSHLFHICLLSFCLLIFSSSLRASYNIFCSYLSSLPRTPPDSPLPYPPYLRPLIFNPLSSICAACVLLYGSSFLFLSLWLFETGFLYVSLTVLELNLLNQAGFELTEIHLLLPPWVLGLKTGTTITWQNVSLFPSNY